MLGSGPSGGSAFISPDLGAAATATKSGYSVSMDGAGGGTTTACNGSAASALSTGYHAWANPVSTSTGTRYFGTNTTGTIWQSHRDAERHVRQRDALRRQRHPVSPAQRTSQSETGVSGCEGHPLFLCTDAFRPFRQRMLRFVTPPAAPA